MPKFEKVHFLLKITMKIENFINFFNVVILITFFKIIINFFYFVVFMLLSFGFFIYTTFEVFYKFSLLNLTIITIEKFNRKTP